MMIKVELPGGDTDNWAHVCDMRIDATNHVASRHERVWVCEVCERAPAAFLCKADAASLCVTCDANIHSANPLAHLHQRVPITLVSGCVYGTPAGQMFENKFVDDDHHTTDHEGDDDEAVSWLLSKDPCLDFLHSDADNEFCNQQQEFSVPEINCGSDRFGEGKDDQQKQYQNLLFGMECESKSSISQNVSLNSCTYAKLDAMSDEKSPKESAIDDREGRVMRYREKKKKRKFEKTIRYASRKAYAESRPRIKGRFAKRTDVEAEVEQMFTNSLMALLHYPSEPIT
ncbi:unnamed protein product [Amaranthus hypochondriacus]